MRFTKRTYRVAIRRADKAERVLWDAGLYSREALKVWVKQARHRTAIYRRQWRELRG